MKPRQIIILLTSLTLGPILWFQMNNRIEAISEQANPMLNINYGGDVNQVITKDIHSGTGTVIKDGDRVQLHVTLWLYDQRKPDSKGELVYESPENQPETLLIDSQNPESLAGRVVGLAIGAVRQLIIPPKENKFLGKLDQQVPQNRTLLLEIKPRARHEASTTDGANPSEN